MTIVSELARRQVFSAVKVGRSITKTFSTNRIPLNQEKYVETVQSNGVRTITLGHSSSRNSLSLEMLRNLIYNITRDEDDRDLRSIVIAAEPGKVFSAGHNLKELIAREGTYRHQEIFSTCEELMRSIVQCPVPVIAAVDGLAAAAGCQLVAACDIAICTERSSFSTPGINFGIFCSTPGIPLTRSVPRKIATRMLFTGLPISAREAYEAGLVSMIVPNDKLDEETKKITDAISSKSRSVTHLGKRFLYEQIELDIFTAYSLGSKVMIDNLKLKDTQEGIKSFSEKREPKWTHSFEREK